MTTRFYNPWVGDRYKTEGYLGKRLLILGESHYGVEQSNHPNATTDIIGGMVINEGGGGFYQRVQSLVTGDSGAFSKEQRTEFWQRVAFCNFIQTPLTGPRVRPTTAMWKSGQKPFQETLEELTPQAVLVLGVGLRWHLPTIPADISVCYLKHPSSRGFSPVLLHPTVHTFLTAAPVLNPSEA